MAESQVYRRKVVVTSEHGLHIRPCTLLAQLSSKFHSRIHLTHGKHQADAKSILDLMTLAAAQGTEIELAVEGSDAAEAIEQVAGLFESGFAAPSPSLPVETAAM